MNLKKAVITRVRPYVRKRKFQVYCVGIAKSGTTSLSGMFMKNYSASHEPETELMIETVISRANGSVSDIELAKFVRKRDRRLWFEMESSFLCCFLVDVLVREFPDSKFILTIRDCYSWLISIFNHKLSRTLSFYHQDFVDWWLGPKRKDYTNKEKLLAENGLCTLNSYLSAWNKHNSTVLEKVPESRLLVLRTNEITKSIPQIAKFLDIPAESIDRTSSHLYKAKDSVEILNRLDVDFLDDQVDLHCKRLMRQFFPEVRSFENYQSAQV